MKISQMLQSVLVLAAISLISADELSLSLSHPDSRDLSIVRFTCYDGEDRAVTATFQKNGEEITDQISVIINSGGILEFEQNLDQGFGDTFTCTDNGITSNAVTLPGELRQEREGREGSGIFHYNYIRGSFFSRPRCNHDQYTLRPDSRRWHYS